MAGPTGILAHLRRFVDRDGRHPCRVSDAFGTAWIHEIAAREKHTILNDPQSGSNPGYGWRFWQLPVWSAIVLHDACLEIGRHSSACGRGWKQIPFDFWHMFRYAMRFNLPPRIYYQYRLFRPGMRAKVGRIIPSWTFGMVCRAIARRRRLDIASLAEKSRFLEFCNAHDLATIPVWAPDRDANPPSWVRGDLFVKVTSGFGGSGCAIIRYQPESGTWAVGDRLEKFGRLHQAAQDLFPGREILIQPRLSNHPLLQRFGSKALSTVRILTAKDREGKPQVLRATLRMSLESEVVDNFSQGGIAAAVDPETGRLGKCFQKQPSRFQSRHPQNGEPIEGFHLPEWNAAKDLVCGAHRAVPDYNFLGWDVAITGQGALLVECNPWPQVEIVQLPQDEPLLDETMVQYLQWEFSEGCCLPG